MTHSIKEVNNYFKKSVSFFDYLFSSSIEDINKIFNLIIKRIYHVQHMYIKPYFLSKVNNIMQLF